MRCSAFGMRVRNFLYIFYVLEDIKRMPDLALDFSGVQFVDTLRWYKRRAVDVRKIRNIS